MAQALTAPALESNRRRPARRALLSAAVAATLAALALIALRGLLREVGLADIADAFAALQPWQIGAALSLTALSYATLTFYDVIALRMIGRRLPWRTTAFAAFTGYALSHNLGLSLVTGGSARLRIYGKAGLGAADVARIIAIAGATLWGGLFAVAAFAVLVDPGALPLALDPGWARAGAAGVLASAALAVYAGGGRTLCLFGWSVPLPTAAQAAAQAGIGFVDLLTASAALFVLVPHASLHAYAPFALAYVLACAAGLVSHVPGGLGVFEAVLAATLPGPKAELLAALIAYRVIYYIAPLGCAALLLAALEARRTGGALNRLLISARTVAGWVTPTLVSLLVFFGGSVLLVSGSLPGLPERLAVLARLLPLPFIEASHLSASLAGTALLLLAPGLHRRLDGAFVLTRFLLVAGAIFSLGKGLDFEEAAVLAGLAALLQWTRPAFYRRTALTSEPISLRWLATIAAALALSVWLGFFAYRHVAYSNDLWWRFALRADAARFLRGSLGAAALVLAWLMWRLLAPTSRDRPVEVLPPDVATAAFTATDRSEAMLALTGDKCFLVSRSGAAFLMYRVRGRSWIVMGDPVGPPGDWAELLWSIRGLADAAQGKLLLYQITSETLPIAIEMGLQIVKYGEEASVDLKAFALEGGAMRALRQCVRRAEREGAEFELVRAAGIPAILPELKAVSDAWLAARGHGEKGFSLGRFDPDYLGRFDCGVIRHRGAIVAFANLWKTHNKAELSVDLMRHAEHLPYGAMDLVFARLMLWGRDNGYRRFSLGIAPLSGIEARRLSPAWAKAASFLFRHGERVYRFEGLRAYKEKFGPVWSPRYIAGPRGLALVRSLLVLQSLIGGKRPRQPMAADRARSASAASRPGSRSGTIQRLS
ncbi:MAG: phosphatidylglycerol lysyltransferase [Sphingomonadales bacterium]|jgi:phosphatidylglycerol lysyltransferase|nr:phosphatidylglycerol lysyltransferase [Sphingomonadales bacterium]